MTTESAGIERLIREEIVRDGAWRHEQPSTPQGDVADRVRGMLLGVAIGDALGNTTESSNPADRAERHGEIRDYLPNRHAGGRAVGLPSDDSQLTFWTVERLVVDGELVPRAMLDHFAASPIFGIGSAVSEALANHRANPVDWLSAGSPSAGNGALMRIAPVLLPHLMSPSPALWPDAALATVVTHRDPAAVASSVAWIAVLWDLISMSRCPDPDWWMERFVRVARAVEPAASTYRPRGGEWFGFEGSFTQWLDRCRPVIASSATVFEAGRLWHSGAYLLETVPTVLHVLARHAHEPEEAMVRAVNDTRDNDTVAAIVGAAVGALHGTAAFPQRWIRGLLGRTRADDDGHVFELIDQAVERFVPG